MIQDQEQTRNHNSRNHLPGFVRFNRTGREQMRHRVQVYSITSSASARRDDGKVRPSIRAVSR